MLASQDAVYYAAGLVVYQLVYRLAECIMSRAMPQAYAKLRQGCPYAYRMYFMFVIALFVSGMTGPVCLNAALTSIHSDGDEGTSPNDMSLAGKICVESRAVMWSSELPLVLHWRVWTLHHFLSLGSMALVLFKQVPLMPLYLIYAGLVAELFLDGLGLLRAHGYNRRTSVVYKRLELMNGFVILFLRTIPAAAVTAIYLYPRRSALSMQAYIACVTFYCGWTLFLAGRLFAKQGHIKIDRTLPTHISITGGLRIPVLSIFLGTAMVAAQAWTAVLYSRSKDAPISTTQAREMALLGFSAAAVGLLFLNKSPSTSSISNAGDADTIEQKFVVASTSLNVSSAVSGQAKTVIGSLRAPFPGNLASPKGVSIQGGLFSTLAWLMSSRQMSPPIDKAFLIYCVGTSLPLAEAIVRMGLRFGESCGSSTTKGGRRLLPHLQLLSACLNFATFCITATCVLCGYLPVRTAGLWSMGANATLRLVLDSWRKEAASRLDFCQLLTSVVLLLRTGTDVDEAASITSAHCIVSLAIFFAARGFIARAWVSLIRDGRSGKLASHIGMPTLLISLFSIGIIALCCQCDDPSQESAANPISRTNVTNPVLHSPSIINYALATSVTPIVAMSTWSRDRIVGGGILHYSGRADTI